MYKLATLALPIDANAYNHNPPMQEHSQCIRDSAASLSIYCKISMQKTDFVDRPDFLSAKILPFLA
jgi:hypothetical protein